MDPPYILIMFKILGYIYIYIYRVLLGRHNAVETSLSFGPRNGVVSIRFVVSSGDRLRGEVEGVFRSFVPSAELPGKWRHSMLFRGGQDEDTLPNTNHK